MSITAKEINAGFEATKIILRARMSAEPSKQPVSVIVDVANAIANGLYPTPGDPWAEKRRSFVDIVTRKVMEDK